MRRMSASSSSRAWRKEKGIKHFLSALRSRSLLRIERRDRERDFQKVNQNALRPNWGEDTTTVLGHLSFYQDLEYIPKGGRFVMRIRYRNMDSENNQLIREGLVRHLNETGLRIKGNPSRSLGLLAEFQNRQDTKRYSGRALSNRDIRVQIYTLEASYRPRP